ncbi:ABC transporter permease subunit [Dactylosporangium sp. McL0621]|uniref:ABC transporter permease subunit n=1 Tax=Dactylosporangium sp. McL0621 TaxID=3415678 RepID=UPI003CF8FCEE
MIWMAWRQHRLHLLAAAAVAVVVAAAFLGMRGALMTYLRDSGLAVCLAQPAEGCGNLIGGLRQQYPGLLDAFPYLTFAPVLAGLFWGAPLVAGEVEHGTHRLAWTQAVSRRRWLWTKVALLGTGCLAAGLAVGALDRWFLEPYFRAGAVSPVQRNWVGLLGVGPAVFAVFAFAVGVLAGTYARRSLPAMVATLAVFVPLRLGWEQLRYRLLSPVRVVYPIGAARPATVARQDWRLDLTGTAGPDGQPVPDGQIRQWCAAVPPGKGGLGECLATHGVQQVDWFVPADRFWQLQALDAAVFGAAAAVLLAMAAIRVVRRVG